MAHTPEDERLDSEADVTIQTTEERAVIAKRLLAEHADEDDEAVQKIIDEISEGVAGRPETTMNEYQAATEETVVYPRETRETALAYTALGLNGEAGEVADIVKKEIRGDPSHALENKLRAELSDVLWYLARTAEEAGWSLETIATYNLEKLRSRKEREELKGSGDDR